ncbi:MAG: FHA domain-containing protein [Phycisphaerales bacterium]|nr:FHA domain-containing protein [Phycisphaerales bacterium]
MPTLQVLQGPDKGQLFQLSGEGVVLGRYSQQVPLTDHTVSRRHAELRTDNGSWRIFDLGSSNGTYVNGDRIDGSAGLKHNAQIKIGSTVIVFKHRGEVRGYNRPASARGMVDVGGSDEVVDSAVLSAIQSGDESIILAAPETADAVHAWNLMYQLAEAISAISSIDDMLAHVNEIILRHLPVDRVFMLMRDEETGELNPIAMRYRAKERRGKKRRITVSRSMIRHVIDERKGVLCANADKRFGKEAMTGSLQELALMSVICVPIVGHEKVHGVIHLDCAMSRHTYSHEQLRLATAVGSMVGLAIENHQLMQARMKSARLAATGETVAYLSHHIRNMLQGLRSGADVVEAGLRRDNLENVRTGWQIIEHNLDRVYHLATNMLTFSKDREPRIEMVQLNHIVEEVIELAQRPAAEAKVKLDVTLGEIPPIPADSDGIHQAVFNLVLNAIAASPETSGCVRIATNLDASGNMIGIAVCDNGPGIPEAERNSVFTPFHSSKGQGGTGLGLAAAKKIVNELGGEITINSPRGGGACFTIRLAAERSSSVDLGATHGPAH